MSLARSSYLASMQLRLATCMRLPEPDPDKQPLDAALVSAGIGRPLARAGAPGARAPCGWRSRAVAPVAGQEIRSRDGP